MLLHELNSGYTVERLADGALLVSPNGAAGGMRNANLALQLGLWERRARNGGNRFRAFNASAISTARPTRRSSSSREPTSARSN